MAVAQLALAKTFLESYSRLPKKQQKKVRELTEKFTADPSRSGLNFETLGGSFDPKVRSLRVDQTYRLILVQPDRGDVLLCVWVDNHDEAYRWAERKTFEVNPLSGVLQVYSVEAGQAAVTELHAEEAPVAHVPARLFDRFDDEELLLGGVPEPLLASVRALSYEPELDALAPHLPDDAADMLYLLASGHDFMTALEEASRPAPKEVAVDVDDFAAALERPASQGVFHLVEGEGELEAMLNAPLEQWRTFLHPSQRRIVKHDAGGPIRVLGGAGTGKTVVLMHRAKYLAEQVFTEPEDRLLVTTFTRNLALDLEQMLTSLSPSGVRRIEVKNLHAWARSFYEQRVGRKIRILESEERRRELMSEAATVAPIDEWTATFYLEEWDRVVQAQDVDSKEGYFAARRVGRGTRLGRQQRAAVWSVLARYRELLEAEGQVEWQDVVRETRLVLEASSVRPPYRAVLADEVQDLSPAELRLLRAMVPKGRNDLFLVGDGHQRIYGHVASMGSCGIEVRGRGRSYRLRLNYRTTEQIRTRACSILEDVEIDDLDEGVDSLKGYRSLRSGPTPELLHCDQPASEEQAIVSVLRRWLADTRPADICVAARTNRLVDRYAQVLEQAAIGFERIQTKAIANRPGVRLATMHRLKGLEFKKVLLAGVQQGNLPLELPSSAFADDASREDHVKSERCLLYVAVTRARDELVITGFGAQSPLLGEQVLRS